MRAEQAQGGPFTVDDVAELTDLTPRTIRSYQTQGLLPPPEHHGRVAYYDRSHLDRLEVITELKERGLSLADIKDVLARREAAGRARPGGWPRPETGGEKAPPKAPEPTPASRASSGAGIASPLTGLDLGPSALGNKQAESRDPSASQDREGTTAPRRRGGLLVAVLAVLLLAVAALSSVFAVLRLNDAEADRERLGRQVSDLKGDLSRIDVDQGPPSTVLVPVPGPQPPPPAAPAAPARPVTRTVVVTTPPPPPAPSPPVSTPPSPPTTQNCTVKLLSVCL